MSPHLKGKTICQSMSENSIQKQPNEKLMTQLVELHADKVPRLSDEHQTGGALTTRAMKREVDEEE